VTGLSSPASGAAGLHPADAPSAGCKPAATGCALRAFGVVRATQEAIAALRPRPGPPDILPGRIRPNLLKHSDEQTVVSLAAVLAAMQRFQLGSVDFTSWGVVAAPRRLGRPRAVVILNRFGKDGLVGAAPMTIPHLSLHAVSGTISQALDTHGPNFGVGSGTSHLGEGLLAAFAVLTEGRLPGLWLTLSQWDWEPAVAAHGQFPPDCLCSAAALALEPVGADYGGPQLRLLPAVPAVAAGLQAADAESAGCKPAATVRSLIDFLDGAAPGGSWLCPLAWGGWVELTGRPEQAREARP
jgi:hypothetical protein